MNSRWYMVAVLCFVFLLSGCTKEVQPSSVVVDKPESKTVTVIASDIDPRTKEYSTKLSEFLFDINSDQEEEQIELWSVASRDESGRMAWDDGQKWLLVVVDKNKYYPLFSEFVQLGQVYFNVSTIGEERIPEINVMIATQCGIEIIDFKFDDKRDCFEGAVKYKNMEKNQYFTSIPSY